MIKETKIDYLDLKNIKLSLISESNCDDKIYHEMFRYDSSKYNRFTSHSNNIKVEYESIKLSGTSMPSGCGGVNIFNYGIITLKGFNFKNFEKLLDFIINYYANTLSDNFYKKYKISRNSNAANFIVTHCGYNNLYRKVFKKYGFKEVIEKHYAHNNLTQKQALLYYPMSKHFNKK